MRALHTAELDEVRPVLILTRDLVRPHLSWVTVAPITTTVRGLAVEVAVGPANGLNEQAVVNCENVTTIRRTKLGSQIGVLLDVQEQALTAALHAAFDLR